MYTWGRYDIMIGSSLTSNLIFITLATTERMIIQNLYSCILVYLAEIVQNVSNDLVHAMLRDVFRVTQVHCKTKITTVHVGTDFKHSLVRFRLPNSWAHCLRQYQAHLRIATPTQKLMLLKMYLRDFRNAWAFKIA